MTDQVSDISLYLTVMANGPGHWSPEQVKEAYEFAKSLMPKGFDAEVVDFSSRSMKFPVDKH